jgi:DNA-directed RNA polymerase II subunit RPB1
MDIYDIFGIEAARQAIYNELMEVIEFDGTYINFHHISVLIDRMTHTYKLISIFRHGLNNDDTGPIAKASFEETPEMFLKAARHGELDIMRGVSANVMCGQEGMYGTNSFQVVLDMERMKQLQEQAPVMKTNVEEEIEKMYHGAQEDTCDISSISTANNVLNVKIKDSGNIINNYNAGF